MAAVIAFLQNSLKPPQVKHAYNKAIEQYRGVCALMVMISHGLVYPSMLLDDFHWPDFVNYVGAGYLSVLIFFCISGYVIGINYTNNNLNVKNYLGKRLIRLYPIYLISVILCIIIIGWPTINTLFANLLFLQNDAPYGNHQIPAFLNYVTWTLNFEVLYYLLFIGLFFWQPRVGVLLLFLLSLSVITMYNGTQWHFLSNYINGYYFWVLGLLLAWHYSKNNGSAVKFVPFLSFVFLHMCQYYLGLGQIILHLCHIYITNNFSWLFDLPFCLMIMATLTGKDSTFLRFNKAMCYIIPGLLFSFLFYQHRLFENTRWVMCILYWSLALIFYFEKKASAFMMEKFTHIGQISYGIYLFHVPIAYLIKKIVFIDNKPAEVIVKYLLWISLTMLLSVLAEKKLQPAIKRYFAG